MRFVKVLFSHEWQWPAVDWNTVWPTKFCRLASFCSFARPSGTADFSDSPPGVCTAEGIAAERARPVPRALQPEPLLPRWLLSVPTQPAVSFW